MSHWRKFNSNVLEDINKDLLHKAMQEMKGYNGEVANLDFNESITSIRNTWGHEAVSAGLTKNGTPIALGFNFTEKGGKTGVELSGDFYSTGLDERSFIDSLAQLYQKHHAVEAFEDQGWDVDEIKETSNGEIEVYAYQWA